MNISMGNLNAIMSLIKIYSDMENNIFITELWHFPTVTYLVDIISIWLIKE